MMCSLSHTGHYTFFLSCDFTNTFFHFQFHNPFVISLSKTKHRSKSNKTVTKFSQHQTWAELESNPIFHFPTTLPSFSLPNYFFRISVNSVKRNIKVLKCIRLWFERENEYVIFCSLETHRSIAFTENTDSFPLLS